MSEIASLLKHPAIMVRVAQTKGSAPRGEDAFMIVTAKETSGTIGGGQLEYMAIDYARSMLAKGVNEDTMQLPLGPDIGQCCGGNVMLSLTRVQDPEAIIAHMHADKEDQPHVYIFGAGHVGKALARALVALPLNTHVVETREAELKAATDEARKHLLAMPETLVPKAPQGSAFITMTHDHALDFIILNEVFKRDDTVYVGMIGSATKRAQFERWYEREGGNRTRCRQLVSPIGGPSKDKRPAVIAALTAAEILRAFELAPRHETV